MDQKPKIPTLKDSQKPQVRIKGLASRLSLVERLKQFKKKDLAFILAGLGVLFMAPLAEHFMMSPENAGEGTGFKRGWNFSANGRFGDGTSPYESGVNGLAPGGFAGGGGDVITPLNVRDPSSLIMGPGATAQPAATSTTPPLPAKENTDWKDAIANAASKGASAATKAASLPVPKASLTNAGLRGLGAASGGGSSAQWNAPPISASHAPNSAAQSNSLGYVSKAPGYAGVGSRGPTDGSAGSLAALKNAAANAGNALNRQGSAVTAAEQAAGMNMPGGSGNGGTSDGGMGKDDKGGSGNSNKDSKSLGESLAFLAAKENQQHAIDLYWKLKEKEAMLWPDLKQKLLEEAVMTPFKALTAGIADQVKGFGSDAPGNYYLKCSDGTTQSFATPDCASSMAATTPCKQDMHNGTFTFGPYTSGPRTTCTKEKGSSSDATPKAETAPQGQNVSQARQNDGGSRYQGKALSELCTANNTTAGSPLAKLKLGMKALAEARDAMSSTNSNSKECDAVAIVSGGGSIPGYNQTATDQLNKAFDAMSSCLSYARTAVGDGETNPLKTQTDVDTALTAAKTAADATPMVPATVAQQDKAAQDAFKTYKDQLFSPAKENADKIKADTGFPVISPALTEAKTALDNSKRYLLEVHKRVNPTNGTATLAINNFQVDANSLSPDALKTAQDAQKNLKDILGQQQRQYGDVNGKYSALRKAYNAGCPLVGVSADGAAAADPANAKVANAAGNSGTVVDGASRVASAQVIPLPNPTPTTLKDFVDVTQDQTVMKLPVPAAAPAGGGAPAAPAVSKDVVDKIAGDKSTDGSYAKVKSNMMDNLNAVGKKVTEAQTDMDAARKKMIPNAANDAPN